MIAKAEAVAPACPCPKCGAYSRVIDSRWSEHEKAQRRRRSCTGCAYRWTTYEWSTKLVASRTNVVQLRMEIRALKRILRAISTTAYRAATGGTQEGGL